MAHQNRMVIFKNKSKDKFSEKWYTGRGMANYIHPFRMVICGRPNSGKSTNALNVILNQNPPFQRIYLMYPTLSDECDDSDDDNTDDDKHSRLADEYSAIDYQPLTEFPKPNFFDAKYKNLLIIDDVELRDSIKKQRHVLNKLLSFTSSHKSLSIIITSQDLFSQCLPAVYRFMNVYCIYRFDDLNYLRMLLSRIGVDEKSREGLMSVIAKLDNHSFITIDRTDGTPAPMRLGHFEKIAL